MKREEKKKIKLVSRGEPVVGCGGDPPPPPCNTAAKIRPYCSTNRYTYGDGYIPVKPRL